MERGEDDGDSRTGVWKAIGCREEWGLSGVFSHGKGDGEEWKFIQKVQLGRRGEKGGSGDSVRKVEKE